MKRLMLLVVLVALMVAPAFAETTGNGIWDHDIIGNHPYSGHGHNYYDGNTQMDLNLPEERDMEWGAGLDVVLFENDTVAFTAENKYDFGNNEYKGYGVVTVKLGGLFKK